VEEQHARDVVLNVDRRPLDVDTVVAFGEDDRGRVGLAAEEDTRVGPDSPLYGGDYVAAGVGVAVVGVGFAGWYGEGADHGGHGVEEVAGCFVGSGSSA